MPGTDHRTGDDAGSTTDATDDAALRSIQFEASGDLSDATFAALRELDGATLGAAITQLLARAALLEPPQRNIAVAAIERAFTAGTSSAAKVRFDAPKLIEIYRTVMADPSRRDVADLAIRLLATVNRDTIMDSIPIDPAGLDLRVSLDRALDAAAGLDQPVASQPTRGIDFDQFDWGGGADAAPAPVEAREPTPAMDAEPPPMGVRPDFDAEPQPTMAEPPEPEAPAGYESANGGGATTNGHGATTNGHESPAPAPAPTYRAYGVLDSSDLVLVGQPFPIKVGLGERPSAGVSGPPMKVRRPDQKPYMLDVQLFADGFDLAPGESWRQALAVASDDLYPTVVLHLVPRDMPDEMADREISATYSIEGETLGLAKRSVRVTKDEADVAVGAAPAQAAPGANITAPTGEPKAHLTIVIKKGLTPGVLQWSVESELPGVGLPPDRAITSDIGQEPAAFVKSIIQNVYVHGHAVGLFQLLQGYGKKIGDEIPDEVWTAIYAAAKAVAPEALQILLLTDEPYVPWELARVATPFDPKAPAYLGAQANVGRWILSDKSRTDPPRSKNAASMAVVWGVYTAMERLLAAEEEAALLQEAYKAISITAEPVPVFSLLGGTPPADILHFAVHGKYDPLAVGEGIFLVSGPPVNPIQIEGSDLSRSKPFVFLNACQVGAASAVLGDYSGTAQAFLAAGASAVVAPLWSVDDKIAQKIALEFYKEALASAQAAEAAGTPGQTPPVADLLRRARHGLIDDAGAMSATYLAYQFYGHPSLRLTWAPEAASGAPSNG